MNATLMTNVGNSPFCWRRFASATPAVSSAKLKLGQGRER
jgi:hypothetical protein